MARAAPVARVAMLAPMRPELKPLVTMLKLERVPLGDGFVHKGKIGDVEVLATITGIGPPAGADTAERLLSAMQFDHLMVVGIAGGLGPVEIGDVIVPEVVIDMATKAEFRPSPLGDTVSRGNLLMSGVFDAALDSYTRFVDEGALAVDMETAAVAEVCERHGVPWSVFRGISDRVRDGLIDQAEFGLARPDGSANMPAVARYVLRRPWRVGRLAKLGKDINLATNAAATAAIRSCKQHDAGQRPTA
ncbi:MAG TPA: 5'-methylthioadenosine/S-adenosylhomocysteine nucleosidase [Acidimicrobiia bacterium]